MFSYIKYIKNFFFFRSSFFFLYKQKTIRKLYFLIISIISIFFFIIISLKTIENLLHIHFLTLDFNSSLIKFSAKITLFKNLNPS